MMGEALLRLRRYEDAFRTFDDILHESLKMPSIDTLEIAPFRLLHDANQIDYMVSQNQIHPDCAQVSANFRDLAQQLEADDFVSPFQDLISKEFRRTTVESLSASQRALIDDYYNRPPQHLPQNCGHPRSTLKNIASPLNPAHDWKEIQKTYQTERVVVIDDFLSAEALAELWSYTLGGAAFRTMRAGFLGAFPGDGATHPIVLNVASLLEEAMPAVFKGHSLGLWWFFKYVTASPNEATMTNGIGIHADPAAVNINLWLTPDDSHISGGGLDIFKYVPPLERNVHQVNHEFENADLEKEFYKDLEQHGVVSVKYKCNRAVLFVSDQYHVSTPFRFAEGYENCRANLTFLYGDRIRPDSQQ
jgi:hypothetical protein